MSDNPYRSPQQSPGSAAARFCTAGRRVRLTVFSAHCLLLLMFPPTCCPCGYGPIGPIVQPYLMVLGFPTILIGMLAPGLADGNPALYLGAFLVNFAVVAYAVGCLAESRVRRSFPER